MEDTNGRQREALRRLERAVDLHLGRSAWTQTKHLKGFGYSQDVRKELYAAHDEARAALAATAVECEPQIAVTEDGYTDWVCPKPVGYLMQCCDCGLIHEAEFRVAKYEPRPSEEYTVVADPDLQTQFRMRRYPPPVAAQPEREDR